MINNKEEILYPETNDPNFSVKIFKKREFYYNKIPQRDILTKYEDIKEYREDACKTIFKPTEQQAILSNFISPYSPYNGILVMHGTGTGKTASAILIAEQFKDQVKKYDTKIFVLTPGPNIRENFKNELLFATGETYLNNKGILDQMTHGEINRERKIAIYSALQYYKILSYKTFYRKVLGEKLVEKKLTEDNKIKLSYKKNIDGEIEREIVSDRITNMNNSILIVDEAHNLTGNEYGEALKKISKLSTNLKIILLTATPMKNLANDIIELINFIRPENDKIKKERVFFNYNNYNHMLDFKEGGKEYLKKMVNGYVSYFRGNIPYTFADRIDMGKIPKELLFTPIIRCYMHDFQLKTYKKVKKEHMDALDRHAITAANFVIPGLNKEKNKIIGYYSTDGINKLLSQLSSDKTTLLNLINKQLFKNKIKKAHLNNFIFETNRKTIGGDILKLDYLIYFSSKFHQAIIEINNLVNGKKGSGTAFVYFNLVRAGGIELFAEALISNGYFEYNENNEYDFQDNSLDAITGLTLKQFKKNKKNMNDFKPSIFILITSSLEDGEDMSEVKQRIIREVFNNTENKHGSLLKLVLGSKVMNEGWTLENTKEVHILDVHYNLAKVEQVIGRAIRFCKHMAITNENNPFPKVQVYRYVVSLSKELSSDEILYQKAEKKYLLVKKVEKILKETAIDCPLLLHGNKFPEEIKKYKGCYYPTIENRKKGRKICPALCDFEECELKCYGDKLNNTFWNSNKKTYKNIDPKNLDYSTFNEDLAKHEINNVKEMIKDLYRFKTVYLYDEILRKIKKAFKKHQEKLFINFFLDKALEDLMPQTENEYFTDIVRDKFNRTGYLKQYNQYYIFQPFNENENVPYYYRNNLDLDYKNLISVNNYLNKNYGKPKSTKIIASKKENNYDFDSVLDYYSKRNENFIVGIIDKNLNKLASKNEDLFKIREPIVKNLEKKRGTGIPTFKGAVCSTSKSIDYLLDILKKIDKLLKKYNLQIENIKYKNTRENICNVIKKKLLILEKYSKSKNKNKITYVMIPKNHPTIPFPYNLEDRIKYIIEKLELTNNYLVKKVKENKFDKYTITIKKQLNDKQKILLKKLSENCFKILIK